MNITGLKHLDHLLIAMCGYVNYPPWKINRRSMGWFRKAEWTEEEQDQFREFVIDYMKGNRQAQNELIGYSANKREIEEFADFFVFNYGWKLK